MIPSAELLNAKEKLLILFLQFSLRSSAILSIAEHASWILACSCMSFELILMSLLSSGLAPEHVYFHIGGRWFVM